MGLFDSALGLLGIGADIFGSSQSARAQRETNRTNIKLQREQQAWEAEMSNTAIQRRAADIEAAGGNRALAFVTGSEASTPSIAPARVEAPDYRLNLSAKLLQRAQMANLAANTANTAAQARKTKVEADLLEKTFPTELNKRINRNVEEYEWDDLRTAILRNQETSSAAEAKRLKDTVDSIIAQAKSAAEKGDLDVKALRNIVNVGGLAPEDKDSIMRYLIDVLFRGK